MFFPVHLDRDNDSLMQTRRNSIALTMELRPFTPIHQNSVHMLAHLSDNIGIFYHQYLWDCPKSAWFVFHFTFYNIAILK